MCVLIFAWIHRFRLRHSPFDHLKLSFFIFYTNFPGWCIRMCGWVPVCDCSSICYLTGRFFTVSDIILFIILVAFNRRVYIVVLSFFLFRCFCVFFVTGCCSSSSAIRCVWKPQQIHIPHKTIVKICEHSVKDKHDDKNIEIWTHITRNRVAQRTHTQTHKHTEKERKTAHLPYSCIKLDAMRHATQFHIRSCNKYSFCQFSLFSPFIWLLASFYFTFVLLDERALCAQASQQNERMNEQFGVCVCVCECVFAGVYWKFREHSILSLPPTHILILLRGTHCNK